MSVEVELKAGSQKCIGLPEARAHPDTGRPDAQVVHPDGHRLADDDRNLCHLLRCYLTWTPRKRTDAKGWFAFSTLLVFPFMHPAYRPLFGPEWAEGSPCGERLPLRSP